MSAKKILWLAGAIALLAFGVGGQTALGANAYPVDTGAYPHGAQGHDVSFPQCDLGLPETPRAFGILGVTHGHAFTYNPCLHDEFVWAQQAPGVAPSLYMNLNYAVGWSAPKGWNGPKGDCARADEVCRAYNYGYNAAVDAFNYAAQQGVGASMWWIDVESLNTWSDDTNLNDVTIQAAIDFVVGRGATVGVYSTPVQWSDIAGRDFVPALPNGAHLPNWTGTQAISETAAKYCAPRYGFGGGRIWLVQYPGGNYDVNYAC
jgi:hypothetical protein